MALVNLAGRFALSTLKRGLRALMYFLIGAMLMVVIFGVRYLDNRPDLKVWHTAKLDAEYTRKSGLESFQDYLALEERLFAQLDSEVYARIEPEDRRAINRYHRGSFADPNQWDTNWNRSFEFKADNPKIGVLLLHGMSDSPYSLRAIGERLSREDAWVIGLRVPGHGTAPSGLVDVTWQDMAGAVELAMQHLKTQANGAPLYIIGYSNGGALAVQYALKGLSETTLPAVDGLVLLSPEIGITRLAALAVWQERLGHLIGLEKLAWNAIQPEYDAFKYGSFALNAGVQAHLLTQEIQNRITRLSTDEALDKMPPMLAFQSVVDATVTAPALVANLYERMPKARHELVLYDINRFSEMEPILATDPSDWISTLLRDRQLDYRLTLITNENDASERVVARLRAPGSREYTECPLNASWPDSVYSLSHVAPPFRFDDPLYGGKEFKGPYRLQLGNIALRGERGVLQISEADLLRLRWNPFYDYQEAAILRFLGLRAASEATCKEIEHVD